MLSNVKPVEDESSRTADMQVACRRGRESSPDHELSVYCEGPVQANEAIRHKLLGAQRRLGKRIDGRAVERPQIIAQGFPFMGKAAACELPKFRKIHWQFLSASEENSAGIDFGRRMKSRGRNFRDETWLRDELSNGAQIAVVARAGRGQDTLRHFPLHQENGTVEARVEREKLFDDR